MRHRPMGSGLKFRLRRMERFEIAQMCAIPLVDCRVEFKENLVESPNKVNRQVLAIFLFRQPADEALGQPHLEEAAIATTWTVVEPTLEQTEITRHLISGLEEGGRKRIGTDQFMGGA